MLLYTMLHNIIFLLVLSVNQPKFVFPKFIIILFKLSMYCLILLVEFGGPKSCLDVATLCLGDSVCNRHLAALMTACPVNGTACNVKDCKRTIRAFYETMPFNMSQMLAFCDCDQSHETCHLAGDVLHSKSCTAHSDVPISCLNVVSSCLDSELCRLVMLLYCHPNT